MSRLESVPARLGEDGSARQTAADSDLATRHAHLKAAAAEALAGIDALLDRPG